MAVKQNARVSANQESETDSVVFKGYKSGLYLLFPENGSFEEHVMTLQKRLAESKGFFKGAGVRLQFGKRVFHPEEWKTLTGLLQNAGMVLEVASEEERPKKALKNPAVHESQNYLNTLTVKQTIRSGQRIEYDGNLLITGDVNPGGEVIAAGDIIVLGKLRGTAHAGALGNRKAHIIALHLKPLQIRIADVFTRAPETVKKNDPKKDFPEVARIKDGFIIVEKFNWDFTKL
jgi:septum site-determining protein MinC